MKTKLTTIKFSLPFKASLKFSLKVSLKFSENPTASTILYGKMLKHSFLNQEQDKKASFHHCFSSCTRDLNQDSEGQGKRGIITGKTQHCALLRWHDSIWKAQKNL